MRRTLRYGFVLALTILMLVSLIAPPVTLNNAVSGSGKAVIAGLDVCHAGKAFVSVAELPLVCPVDYEQIAFISADLLEPQSEHIAVTSFPFTKDQPPKSV